ncbi:MAG: hypothetical protein VKJ24_11780 [Synechococcales bacterium]|nr:hypothetical protein [Synechococcales bacterium]
MSTQRISLDALQKVRQYLRTILVLPEPENRPRLFSMLEGSPAFSAPEPDSLAGLGDLFRVGTSLEEGVPMPNDQGQWFISVVDPGVVFMKLPGLQLKPGMRLVSYLYRMGNVGVGKTIALPEALSTTAHLETALTQANGTENPPQPEGALAHVMMAVEGDSSPFSYLIGSLLKREFSEFGAIGQQVSWHKHQLINTIPQQLQWQWRTEAVKDLSPKVRLLPDGRVIVEFFTCRVTPSIALFQHLDQYAAGQYQSQGVDRAIAIGERKKVS